MPFLKIFLTSLSLFSALSTYAVEKKLTATKSRKPSSIFNKAASPVIGTLDGVHADRTVWGWAVSKALQQTQLTVHFYVDVQPAPPWSGFAGMVVANQQRPDVNQIIGVTGNHGYTFQLPASFADGAPHVLYAYGIDPQGGSNPLLGQTAFQILGSHILYYGYFATAYSWVGPKSDRSNSFINDPEIAASTNTVWISGYTGADLTAKLNEARQKGLKAIVGLDGIFDGNVKLIPNYQDFWRTNFLNPILASTGGISNVVAIYPADEPYWNASLKKVVSPDQMTIQLNQLNTQIHKDLPGTPIAIVMAYPDVVNGYGVPETFDWAGFDCYDASKGLFFEACGDKSVGYHPIPWYVARLKSLMTPKQRLIAVPQGYLGKGHTSAAIQAILATQIDKYMKLVSADSQFVGVFPFMWPSFQDMVGAADLPLVKQKYSLMSPRR